MGDAGLIAQLMAQARGEGADLATLRAIAEEAGELGASRALTRLGLEDAAAAGDMAELRKLLEAWRDAKRVARNEVVGWLTRIVLAALLIGLAVKLGLVALVRG